LHGNFVVRRCRCRDDDDEDDDDDDDDDDDQLLLLLILLLLLLLLLLLFLLSSPLLGNHLLIVRDLILDITIIYYLILCSQKWRLSAFTTIDTINRSALHKENIRARNEISLKMLFVSISYATTATAMTATKNGRLRKTISSEKKNRKRVMKEGVGKEGKLRARKNEREEEEEEEEETTTTSSRSNVGLKAAWIASEQFGKLLASSETNVNKTKMEGRSASARKLDRMEVIAEIKNDYEKNYFVGGIAEMRGYSDDCVFSDPFVSFKGTARFKTNVANFSNALREVDVKVNKIEDVNEGVKAYWRFSGIIDALPWRPKLAASGNTIHVLNEDNLVVKHIEAWDVDPMIVLKSLLVPASKLPENKWEMGMLAVSQKDGFGALQAISEPGVKLFGLLLLLEKIPGVDLGGFELFTTLMFLTLATTEVYALLISFGVVKK
jgi:hypothetical protein